MTTTASRTTTGTTRRRLGSVGSVGAVGAVGVAGAFALVMSFMSVPTPLYGLYEQRDGFGAFTVSLVFAAYGVGVVGGLVLAGHVSDHVGRRPVLLAMVGLEVLCAVGFVLLADTASLVVLRFLTGLGVGGLSATATAAVAELHERRAGADPVVGRTMANVANLGGLALGPLVAGLLSLVGDPIVTPYAVYVGLLVLAAVVLWLAPETVSEEARARPWRYRPQRVGVDPEVRGPFVGASVAALAGFSVLGFITSLTGTFLVEVVGTTSRLTVGAVVTGVLAGGIVSQLLLARAGRRAQLVTGAVLVAVGVLVVAAAGLTASLPVFVGGGFLAAGGVGLVFAASVATVAGLAAPDRRGETLAALFLSAYVGITIPVVTIGALLLVADVVPVLVGFAVVVALAVPAGISVLVRRS